VCISVLGGVGLRLVKEVRQSGILVLYVFMVVV